MEKYVTNIKDFVIQTITNSSEIKAKAESGDALSCFQMGMIYLLGINTSIDFKKASQYFGSQLLADNQDAICLLGFIAECEGDFSRAFQYYASLNDSDNDSYIAKVIKGRNVLQDYLKNMGLPLTLNSEVSSILYDYSKGDNYRTSAIVKIATICDDEQSCFEAARNYYESKEYISAIQWLKKGNVDSSNSIFTAINALFEKNKSELIDSKDIQVVNLENTSLLASEDTTQLLNKCKKTCREVSMKCSLEWNSNTKAYIDEIIRKNKEYNEYVKSLAEDENTRRSNQNSLVKVGAIAAIILVIIIIGALSSLSEDQGKVDEPTPKEAIVVEKSNAALKENREPSVQEEKEHEEINPSNQQEKDNSGYDNVLSERRLSDEDLADKSKKELEIMRNSIYARYGYKFKREDLLNYFSQYSWYNPTTRDMGAIYNMMNDNEKYNVDFIKKHE